MVCRLSQSIINRIAEYQLTSTKPSSGSWFLQILDICLKYSLPSALSQLEHPLPKLKYKSPIKSKVVTLWENQLRAEALGL